MTSCCYPFISGIRQSSSPNSFASAFIYVQQQEKFLLYVDANADLLTGHMQTLQT